jgi:hypothetical protein
MATDISTLPRGPYLLPAFNPGQGGVDYLRLRQVNLDMMAEYIPGINNATSLIRPYSVMCWVYWKFYRMMKENGTESASEAELIKFKEKVETLFVWGHQLEKLRGVPGFLSSPTDFRAGKANLSFASWNRSAVNTSIQAGVQYGPSLSDRSGLGFLRRVEGSFYQVTTRGEALAKALDERLRKRRSYDKLIDLRVTHATEDEAKDLFSAWRSDSPGTEEQEVFREAFFKKSDVGKDSAIARRSTIIHLIKELLQKSRRRLTEDEIRKCMAYGRLSSGKILDLSEDIRKAARKWLLLQVRQVQRLALESIMAWVEFRLLTKGDRQARQLATAAVASLHNSSGKEFQKKTPEEMLATWIGRFKKPEDYIQAAMQDEEQFCLFNLGGELETAVREQPDDIWPLAFKLLMLTRRFYDWLSSHEELLSDMAHGKSERISIAFWSKTWDKNCRYPVIDLVAHVINNMVLSQHFAVATNRYEGETQKLRITLEEEGLELLVSKPWRPYIAADKLQTLLSLMASCNLITTSDSDEGYSA